MYKIRISSRFKKDLKIVFKQHKNIDRVFWIIELLQNEQLLPIELKDHYLEGNYKGFRDLHINADFILIYRYFEEEKILELSRLGTHANLFKK